MPILLKASSKKIAMKAMKKKKGGCRRANDRIKKNALLLASDVDDATKAEANLQLRRDRYMRGRDSSSRCTRKVERKLHIGPFKKVIAEKAPPASLGLTTAAKSSTRPGLYSKAQPPVEPDTHAKPSGIMPNDAASSSTTRPSVAPVRVLKRSKGPLPMASVPSCAPSRVPPTVPVRVSKPSKTRSLPISSCEPPPSSLANRVPHPIWYQR